MKVCFLAWYKSIYQTFSQTHLLDNLLVLNINILKKSTQFTLKKILYYSNILVISFQKRQKKTEFLAWYKQIQFIKHFSKNKSV